MTRRLGVVVLAAGLLAGLLATGCATVPRSGPIRSGAQAGAGADGRVVEVEANPPRPGATKASLVAGFIDAMADPDSLEVARQYLTPEAAATWRPERQTIVYEASDQPVAADENDNIELSGPWIATLDARGSWRSEPPNRRFSFRFEFDQGQGEWRIARAPDGVFLDQDLLEINYELHNLYFFAPALDMLVPDPVYLSRGRNISQRATLLTQALLAGPTARLDKSVMNMAPPGTEVNVSVPVDARSVATVALNKPAAMLGPEERERLAAQITWTLRGGISTQAVRLTADDAPLVEGGQEEYTADDFARYDPVPPGAVNQLFVLSEARKAIEQLTGVEGSTAVTTTAVKGELSHLPAESFSVDLPGRRAAVVSGGAVWVGQLNADEDNVKPAKVTTEGGVLRPSFDGRGNLWIVDRSGGTTPRIRQFTPEGKLSVVSAPGLVGRRLSVLRVAPDGVRVLVVAGPRERSQVLVGRLTRTGGWTLDGLEPVRVGFSDVVDAGWSKPDKITVLAADSQTANHQPLEVNVDGSRQARVVGINDFDGTELAVRPHRDALLVVRDRTRKIHVQSRDLSWSQPLEAGPPLYPG